MMESIIREVQKRELTEFRHSRNVVGVRGLFGTVEVPDVHLPGVHADVCPPPSVSIMPTDTLEPRRVRDSQPYVDAVLRVGDESQVLAPIVQFVPVDVIDLAALRRVEDYPVQLDGGRSGPAATTDDIPVGIKVPALPLSEAPVVGVNDGEQSVAEGEAKDAIIVTHSGLAFPSVAPGALTMPPGSFVGKV